MTELHSSNFDDLVDRFDESWGAYLHGNRPEPPAIVQAAANLPADEYGRAILHSLIKTDLEGRWSEQRQGSGNVNRIRPTLPARGEREERLGRCPRLEDYVVLFPALGSLDQLPADLVEFEFRVREWYSLEAEFEKRFPGRYGLTITPIHALPLPLRYEVVRPLGSGGFGTVYLVKDAQLWNRQVAIKVFKEDHCAEGDTLGGKELRHPGLVRVHDIGRMRDGTQFLVMEYVEGGALTRLLVKDPTRPGRTKALEPLRVARLMRQLAEALAFLHAHGMIHRDIKPANVLLDGDGVCITDYGLVLSRYRQHMRMAMEAGTLRYMAPEQATTVLCAGDIADDVLDGRTDVWALGVILYELLTGEHPFYRPGDKKADVAEKILHHTPAHPQEVNAAIPDHLAKLCLACLSKEKGRRPLARALARKLGVVETALSLEVDVEPSDEMRAQVAQLPRYVSVPTEWVLPHWIRFFVRPTSDFDLAKALLDKAIKLRLSVDLKATHPEPTYPRNARLDSFWADILRQACVCHGPRMLAALIVVIPVSAFANEECDAFLEARATLLEKLSTLSWDR